MSCTSRYSRNGDIMVIISKQLFIFDKHSNKAEHTDYRNGNLNAQLFQAFPTKEQQSEWKEAGC